MSLQVEWHSNPRQQVGKGPGILALLFHSLIHWLFPLIKSFVFLFFIITTILLYSIVLVLDPDGGRDWGQEEKVTTEDEMAGWEW